MTIIKPGAFPEAVFADGTFQENLFGEYGLATPTQTASRLRQIITKMEQQNIGNYCFEPGCVEPGCDNANTLMRRIIEKMETQ